MPATSYPVRKLTRAGRPTYQPSSNPRDPLANAEQMTGAVWDVNCEELRLSSEQLLERLQRRQLRSSDLVMIDGTWTTIADSIPFSEIAEPFARRERRISNFKSAMMLLACISAAVAVLVFRLWISSGRN